MDLKGNDSSSIEAIVKDYITFYMSDINFVAPASQAPMLAPTLPQELADEATRIFLLLLQLELLLLW